MSTIDNFVAAQNFCTGSQSDYSTCIANNLRFLPFNEDTYKASAYAGLSIGKAILPLLGGTTYVVGQPLAIANINTRTLMKNSYGVVSFRCNDVFSKPRLPLPRLQDLGLEAEELLNITEVDIPKDKDNPNDFYGIPLVDISQCTDDSCRRVGYLKNVINLSIGYTKATGVTVNQTDLIEGTINNMGNYYLLPEYAITLDTKTREADEVLAKLISELRALKEVIPSIRTRLYGTAELHVTRRPTARAILEASYSYSPSVHEIDYYKIMNEMADIAIDLATNMLTLSSVNDMYNNVVEPLVNSINPNTDFGYYDFNITKGVAEYIKDYDFKTSFDAVRLLKRLVVSFGSAEPRSIFSEENYQTLLLTIGSSYATEIFSFQSNILRLIQRFYNYSSVPQIVDEVNAILSMYNIMKTYESYYTTNLQGKFDTGEPEKDEYLEAMIESSIEALDTFTVIYSSGNIIDKVNSVYNPQDSTAKDIVIAELDKYFLETGNVSKISAARHRDAISKGTSALTSDKLTITDFGLDFKDSGVFHFADIAYGIAFSRLVDLKQITIDDEIYDLTAIVDEDGNPLTGISQSGCTKFTFTRHVMPTYSPVIEMYIYPGTPDQPYCPTVNKYHNFNACSYSGMFTKLLPQIDQTSGSDIGLYVYKNYRPMQGTVEELIQLGKVDINSINLNDPNLDNKDYEKMVQTEVVNLTNASSIINTEITTDDLKYYLSSKIVDNEQVSNYSNMAMAEFKNFPIGTSFKLPRISFLVTAEDSFLKV